MNKVNRLVNSKGKAKRWTQMAYGRGGNRGGKVWTGQDEGYLKREILEYNANPNKSYEQFLSSVAYTLERTPFQIRTKLKEMHAKGRIPKRSH